MFSAPPPIAMSASPSRIVCAAETIAGERWRRFGNAAVERGHACQIKILRLGCDHVAEYDVTDLVSGNLGACQDLTYDKRTQFGRRQILEASTKLPDGGTYPADNDDFSLHFSLLASRSARRPCFAGPRNELHVRIVRAAAAFRRHPHDVLRRVLDVAGLAVHAVLRVDHETLAVVLVLHELVDGCRAITAFRSCVRLQVHV